MRTKKPIVAIALSVLSNNVQCNEDTQGYSCDRASLLLLHEQINLNGSFQECLDESAEPGFSGFGRSHRCKLSCNYQFGYAGAAVEHKTIKCNRYGLWEAAGQRGRDDDIDPLDVPIPTCTPYCPSLDTDEARQRYLPRDSLNIDQPSRHAYFECSNLLGDTDLDKATDSTECTMDCRMPTDMVNIEATDELMRDNTLTCRCNQGICRWTGYNEKNTDRSVSHLKQCEVRQQKRIINGSNAIKGQDSAIAITLGYYGYNSNSGRREWIHYCGGVLLNSKWAFTAAHCKMPKLRAILGEYKINHKEGTESTCKVIYQIRHDGYDGQTKNDIMLISLKCRKLRMGKYIQKALLPPPDTEIPWGDECKVCGWGNTNYPVYKPAEVLQCVDLPIIDSKSCNVNYVGAIHEDIFCIGLLDIGGKDSCQGDSGGPAVCNGITYGIVMGGLYCAKPEYPGVYTQVSHYIRFAQHVITEYNYRDSKSKKGRSRRSIYRPKSHHLLD